MTEEKPSKEEKENLSKDPISSGTAAKPPDFDDLTKELVSFIKGRTGISPFVAIHKEQLGNSEKQSEKEPKKSVKDIKFDLTPKQVKAHLDRFVIKQDEAKRVLSVAVCDHFNHIKTCKGKDNCRNYTKQNIVILGPTGVGKTFLIKCIAELIGVPFVKSDATKFTETGYVGGDVEDLVRQLAHRADNNIDLAEYGIVYLDEIDKINASQSPMNKDVSGRGVQSNLLKLLEETEVSLKAPWDIQSQLRGFLGPKRAEKEVINTKHILFIVSGAFDALGDITKKRVQGSKFGFEVKEEPVQGFELIKKANTQDFIDYGLEPEFIGRFPVRVFCDELTADDFFKILKDSEASLLIQTIESFRLYGIDIMITDDALKALCVQAEKEKTGARGLATVFELCFRDFKFELPSTSVKKIVVTPDLIHNPELELKKLLNAPKTHEQLFIIYQIKKFEADYKKDPGMSIRFDDDVRQLIINQVLEQDMDVFQICRNCLDKLEYSLNLLTARRPEKEFLITQDVLNNPERYLSLWIREALAFDKA
ncbi:AAA family ATPase [Thermoproteota archaeon]